MVIVGIDPGLASTGYGVVESVRGGLRVVAAGDIRPARALPLAARLAALHEALAAVMASAQPDTAVLEKVLIHARHVTTAAMMAHVRGVACLAAEQHGVPVVEYLPTRIKRALTGRGHASKEQVARMVSQWTGAADASWSSDATDALALAIAHAHMTAPHLALPAGAA